MKKIIISFALLFSTLILYAADTIVLKNSTKIDAKILEVSDTEIKYKKISNPDGPIFTQNVKEISAVIYENGEVTSFSTENASTKESKNKQENAQKLKFNPTPNDRYIIGITAGYLSGTGKETGKVQVTDASGQWIGELVEDASFTPSARLGLTINPTFKYGLGIRTGAFVEYGRKKYYATFSTSASTNNSSYLGDNHDIVISVPLQFSYRYELIPKLSFILYTGPVFDFGVYCVSRYTESSVVSDNIYYVGNSYRGFNTLWGIGGGLQWGRLRVDVGGEFGLMEKNLFSVFETAKWSKPVYVTLTCFF